MVRPVGAGNKIIRIFGRKFFPQPHYAAVQMAGTLRPDGGGIIAGNGIQQNIVFRHNIAKIANGHKIQHAEPRIAVLRSLDQLPQLVFAGGKKPAFVQAAVQLIKHPRVQAAAKSVITADSTALRR